MSWFESTAASGPLLLAVAACAVAGLVSFASPCVVPLVPGYLSYLAGVVGTESSDATWRSRLRVTGSALLFVLGFTVVFLLGSVAIFGVTRTITTDYQLLQRIGGVIVIVVGLVFLGVIPGLQREMRFHPRQVSNWVGAPMLGAVFGLGWTPCLGPTLGSVIATNLSTDGATATRGVVLTLAYCLGLGLPFLIVAIGGAWAVSLTAGLRRHTRAIQIIGGVLMIAVGVLLVTGLWEQFVSAIRDRFVSDWTIGI